MTEEEFNKKYNPANALMSTKRVSIGDKLVYWDTIYRQEIECSVVAILNEYALEVDTEHRLVGKLLNIYHNLVHRIKRGSKCECGLAKHPALDRLPIEAHPRWCPRGQE